MTERLHRSGSSGARPARRHASGAVIATVAWLAVLGGTVVFGLAGRASEGRPAAATTRPTGAAPSPYAESRKSGRSPFPTRPPIGEDGIMGGLPFGTAWQWLEPD